MGSKRRRRDSFGTEVVKCAPENWVVRRPVSRMNAEGTDVKARYHPRNLLNARYKQGTRETGVWIPNVMYREPLIPIIKETCAFNAMNILSVFHRDAASSLHVLEVLKAVFKDMGRTYLPERCDSWLQNKATMLNSIAVAKYRRELNLFVL